MKSLKGQLIAAIAMTLVAIVTITSSTYAWFSMNTTVKATGMEVKAVSSGGLAIAPYTAGATDPVPPVDSAFASEATAVVDSTGSLNPTSTYSGTTWYSATAQTVNSYQKTGVYTPISTNLNQYRLQSKFMVKSLDENTSTTPANLYITGVTVTIKNNTDSHTLASKVLNKALRVAVNYGGNLYFYAPVYAAGSSVTLKCVGSDGATTTSYPNTITLGTGGRTSSIGTINTTAVDLTIFVYYEGEDENCASVNAINIDTLQVSVSLSTTVPSV